jgi:hypothetical protein
MLAAEGATVTTEANLRAQPNTGAGVIRIIPVGTGVQVECWTEGEFTLGSSMWLAAEGGFLHSTLVSPVGVGQCSGTYDSGPAGGSGGGVDGSYDNCDEAPGPVNRGEPGYGEHLDADSDGVGCEPYYGP